MNLEHIGSEVLIAVIGGIIVLIVGRFLFGSGQKNTTIVNHNYHIEGVKPGDEKDEKDSLFISITVYFGLYAFWVAFYLFTQGREMALDSILEATLVGLFIYIFVGGAGSNKP